MPYHAVVEQQESSVKLEYQSSDSQEWFFLSSLVFRRLKVQIENKHLPCFESRRNLMGIYESLGHAAVGKNFFAEGHSSPNVDSEGIRLLSFGTLSWQTSRKPLTKTQWFIDSPEYRELHRIDGEPVVFEWIFSLGQYIAITSRNPKDDGRDELHT